MNLLVRGLTPEDWPAVERVYAEGIAGHDATFETRTPAWADFDTGRVPVLRLVAVDDDGGVVGWAGASPVSRRSVYSGVLEHSAYVASGVQGQGVGRLLLDRFVRLSEALGVWTLRSGVFPENLASLRLHAHLGFREVGRFEHVGRGPDRTGTIGWRDVVLVERRSPLVGVPGEPLLRALLPHADPDGDARGAVLGLLADAGLPPDGLDAAWLVWLAEDDEGTPLGCVALERHDGPAHLLRSVAVRPDLRGTGLGSRLVRTALAAADLYEGRTAAVGLLTDTAAGWFDRFGFVEVSRDALPAGLQASPQLRGVCGGSARAYARPAA